MRHMKGNVYLVNANSYFSRPSPRVVEGIEVLAGILHPELFQLADVVLKRLRPPPDRGRQVRSPR